MDVPIDPMRSSDWEAVRVIYLEGIATGNATFETDVPEWLDWDLQHLQMCRLVARQNGGVIGWAALSAVSGRRVYAGVAKVSIYVAASARGLGIGKKLLQALVLASEQNGFWTLQAGILAENAASLAMHKACGFRTVGVRERLGQLRGVWCDVVLMERRSHVVGLGADSGC
jgi:phosphinothricin acetyltransferase